VLHQRAQSVVWASVMIPVLVLAVGLVVDGSIVFSAQREALGLADGAARAGAAELDQTFLRDEPAAPARLDTAAARATALAFVARHQPSAISDVTVDPRQITVRVRVPATTTILHLPGQQQVEVAGQAEAAPYTGVEVGIAP